MQWLVLIHVLSAVLGIGPTLAFPLLLRNTTSPIDMQRSLEHVMRIEMFPKIFGTLALVTGLLLVWLGSYGTFAQVWLLGSLLLFVAVEVLVIGWLTPATKKLQGLLAGTAGAASAAGEAAATREAAAGGASTAGATTPATALYAHVRKLHTASTALCLLIIVLMILKPH